MDQPVIPGTGFLPVSEMPTRRMPIPFDTAMAPGQTTLAQSDAASPARIRYFGDYEIVREIARGGMGVVFQARQVSLNRPVALKMILVGQLAHETDVKRFATEAEAAANLDHPGIVPIFEIGEHEGQHYFSMGFVEGKSLSQCLADGPLPPREAAALMVKVAEAIEYAHGRGVIHRDLKPANILIDANGSPRVTDFGLAKKVQGDSGLTDSGQMMGTPSYMPPEQAGGPRDAVGPAADVYSLGATLYALVTGRPPFQAATAMDTVLMVLSDEPVPPRRLNLSVPVDLETICLKCLQKEPGKRYASAADLAADLRRFLADEPIAARPVTRLERAVKWMRRRPTIAALVGMVALVTALGLGGVLWQWRAAVGARVVADQKSRDAKDQADLAERRRLEAEARRQDAEQARAKERAQTELAQQRLRDTQIARAHDREQTELAEQRLYDARMNLVQRWWDDYHGALLQHGLDEYLPVNSGGTDRRGFEWFYWRRKLSSGHVTLKGHVQAVAGVAFSADGHTLASASADQTVKMWDAVTGQLIRTLKGHTGPVSSVEFSPDGKGLASASADQTVKVWDAATGKEIRTLRGHTGLVTRVVYSPDGKGLASASADQTVKVWDAATGKELRTLRGHTDLVMGVAYSPDGKSLASAGHDRTVKVWDAGTGLVTRTLMGHVDPAVMGVAFSPDGHRLASTGSDQTVEVWDAASGQLIRTLRGHTNLVSGVAFSPDGRTLASASYDGSVKIWDPTTGQETRTLKGYTNPVTSVAYSPDGRRLAAAGLDGTVKVWDVVAGPETLTLSGHSDGIHTVAFSPDGRTLASASYDATVKVWDVATAKKIRTLKGHTNIVLGVAFRPDGQWLASASNDGAVKVWDAATGKEIRTLGGAPARSGAWHLAPTAARLPPAATRR